MRFAGLLLLILTAHAAFAQGTAFTYQGKLADGGSPATGQYDFEFKLFDTATVGTGTQLGTTQTLTGVAVSGGIFTAQLDFGVCASCFNGAARFLEIAVRPTGGTFTTLAPRQPFTSTPYAIRSQNAATADGLSVACVNCVTSSQIGSVSGNVVTGTIPVASVPAGSANYIQNTSSQQAASNFSISGNGTAAGTLSGSVVSAATQFNLGGQRLLSTAGTGNLFAGINAGANTTGGLNSFFGTSAGSSNTTGADNDFFGFTAGSFNTTGMRNTFIGSGADFNAVNPTGDDDTLLGCLAKANSGVSNGTAIGTRAQVTQSNSLVLGSISGVNGATASTNVGIGTTAPAARLHIAGANNSGGGLAVEAPEGDRATLYYSANTGAVFDSYRPSDGRRLAILIQPSGGSVGIGTTAPLSKLHVAGASNAISAPIATLESSGSQTPLSFKSGATEMARIRTDNVGNLAIATVGGTAKDIYFRAGDDADANTAMYIQAASGNVGIGTTSPLSKLHVVDSSTGGSGIGVYGESSIGAGVYGASSSGYGVYGYSYTGLAGYFSGNVHVTGTLAVGTLGSAGATTLCRNGSNQIATCSSSLRYKTDVRPFSDGLDLLNRLRPIAFTWKQGGMRDLGLAAEEVEKVEPLLVTHNDKGEVEGVKYDRINVLLINAVNQQQQQISDQQQRINQQQAQIEALKKLVCLDHPGAEVCR